MWQVNVTKIFIRYKKFPTFAIANRDFSYCYQCVGIILLREKCHDSYEKQTKQ